MKKIDFIISVLLLQLAIASCSSSDSEQVIIQPDVVTDSVDHDSDDPAIWYNKYQPSKSLVFGTDKDEDGSVVVFDLEGNRIFTLPNLNYPNNIDIVQGVSFGDSQTYDIMVTVERPLERLRFFSAPNLESLDNGNCQVFEGEAPKKRRYPMGVAFYHSRDSNKLYVFVSRKKGPTDGTYIWQYLVEPDSAGKLGVKVVRKFGKFSGKDSEIEALMVDEKLGYVYYSDEGYGVRKYFADPSKGNEEVDVFGLDGFTEDREGIALWPDGSGGGYILVSNQGDNSINVYDRVSNRFVKNIKLGAKETDGIEILARSVGPDFKDGMLVVMSDDRTFQYYDLAKLLEIVQD